MRGAGGGGEGGVMTGSTGIWPFGWTVNVFEDDGTIVEGNTWKSFEF